MEQLLVNLYVTIGNTAFLGLIGVISLVLTFKVIPITTDMMVNSAAGLAGKHVGRQYRTLVINCSTNNPEVATMAVSFLLGKLGGIGTPLGSNFANIYLMFGVALGWVLITLRLRNPAAFRDLLRLLVVERWLVAWHLLMSGGMFIIACFAFRGLTGQFPIGRGEGQHVEPSRSQIFAAAVLCCVGVGLFIWRDMRLRKRRPELFEDIDESEHLPSWNVFAAGTIGLVAGCYVINLIFAVVTRVYGMSLKAVLGPEVFAVLHYFLGALVTSLPEMNVAVKNYRKIAGPDLNTALSSASASNMSNLAIASVGCLIAWGLLLAGFRLD